MTENKLLGNHRPSSEWYTPSNIKKKVFATFDSSLIYDPCPAMNMTERNFYTDASVSDGLSIEWYPYCSNFIYCNPPTPAAPWARKAIATVQNNKETAIIFACFSEAVLWQVNELLDYPVCWVRNRINWIDGNKYTKADASTCGAFTLNGKWVALNANYLKPSKTPRNYNAFVLLHNTTEERYNYPILSIVNRFCEQFSDLGTIQLRRTIYKP